MYTYIYVYYFYIIYTCIHPRIMLACVGYHQRLEFELVHPVHPWTRFLRKPYNPQGLEGEVVRQLSCLGCLLSEAVSTM